MTINIFPRGQDGEPWSSVLIGMVNSFKPVKQQQQTQHQSSRLRSARPSNDDSHHPTFAPTTTHHEVNHNSNHHSYNLERPTKRQKLASHPVSTSPSSTRSDAVQSPQAPVPRPPTKLTQTEPDGDLLQTVNGVQTRLDAGDEDIQNNPNHAIQAQRASETRDRPQKAASKAPDKRTLRSQDEGSRLKSELSIYFPNYEDVINDVPTEPEFLTPETIFNIRPGPQRPATQNLTKPSASPLPTPASAHRRVPSLPLQVTGSAFQSPLANKFNGAQVVDFSSIEKSVPHHPQDPLTDAVYFKAHRRAERKEKQLRNIEKERAMHEKVQLERLLEGLQGHDWLRVLGITGVTDSEAKKYEAKRDYFVSEVNGLVMKFKEWKEEEKRLKLEREAALMAKEEDDAEEDQGNEDADQDSDGELSSSEIDASAARQLQMEASGSTKGKASKSRQRVQIAPPPPPIIYRPPTPEGPFTSFYSKPHLRAAALGKQRHGRHTFAFGQIVPELDEHDFALPADYTTPEALRESARRRRRMKRESLVDSKSGK